jgi:hypothetical protein
MQEVPRENLVPGKEYYMQWFPDSYSGPNKTYKMMGTFEQLTYLHTQVRPCFTNFRSLKHRNEPSCGYNIELALHWKFYEISQNKVQKNMENRAYNQVLLDLIQDDYFTPGNFI